MPWLLIRKEPQFQFQLGWRPETPLTTKEESSTWSPSSGVSRGTPSGVPEGAGFQGQAGLAPKDSFSGG